MKKRILSLFLISCLLLAGCGNKMPAQAADGTPWGKDWVNIGTSLGVAPLSGWTEQRSEDTLAAEGMFYNVWTKGDAFEYENASGVAVTAYAAQIHLVTVETPGTAEAAEYAQTWDQLTAQRYPDAAARTEAVGNQSYSITEYRFLSATEIESLGASATALRGTVALHVDVFTTDGSDPAPILAEFLNSIHYAA